VLSVYNGALAMTSLADFTLYADASRHFSSAGLWALFDGDRERLNLAHECVDRHAASGRGRRPR
jgi:acetyl-CoA synthetase